MKRRSIILIVALIVAWLFPITAYAHPGKTDGRGGHYDRSTGEYHYHHGYGAHSHYDMDGDGIDDCPFDFDDKTGNTAKSGYADDANYGNDKVFTDPEFELTLPRNRNTIPKEHENKNAISGVQYAKQRDESGGYVVPVWSFAVVFALMITSFCYAVNRSNKSDEIQIENEKLIRKVVGANQELIEAKKTAIQFKSELNVCADKNAELERKLAGTEQYKSNYDDLLRILERAIPCGKSKGISEYSIENPIPLSALEGEEPQVTVPSYVVFDKNDMPIKISLDRERPYGDYTVYITRNGSVYHCDRFCSGYAERTVHLFNAVETHRPCIKCAYRTLLPREVPQWYKDIIELRRMQRAKNGQQDFVYDTATNGFTVRIPADKYAQWKVKQEEHKTGRSSDTEGMSKKLQEMFKQ